MPPARCDAEEGDEVVEAGGEHDPHRRARPDAEAGEAGGHRVDPARQLAVGQLLGLAVAGVVEDVPPLGVALGVPVEDLEQGARAVRSHLAAAEAADRRGRLEPLAGGHRRVRRGERLEEVARRLGAPQQLLGEPHAERPLQPGEQLHPAEAVEAEVALQRGIEGDRAPAPLRLQLPREPLDDLQEGGGRRGLGLGVSEAVSEIMDVAVYRVSSGPKWSILPTTI